MNISEWLTGLGLERYLDAFAENEIDMAVLPRLTAEDLKDIGVVVVGHRRKLLEAIATLSHAADAAIASPLSRSAASPRQADAERRQLTVMFVDLVGSTALSAQLDPEDMREIIRTYQNTVAGEITRFEGHVAKFMGDGVLAYFGWPKAHEDEAERAVRTGLAVTRSMRRLRKPDGQPLQARIGIATGLVVVGDLVGEGAAQEQAVVGDTPNLAARLQAEAEPGSVVIADATRRLLGDVFVLRDLGPRTLKGIEAAAPAFAVVGERALESRFAARQGAGVAPIVGRDQELGLLHERWQQAVSGEGQVVLLTGEAGIGKSRITEALVELSATEAHFLLRYQCSPYNADSALYPAIQHLALAAGFSADDDTDRRLDKLEALLARGSEDISEAAPLMAALLGIDAEQRYGPVTLTPQQRRSRTLAVLIDQLAGLASRKPVLWVIEDAHWIDPTTLELIELALDRVQGARAFLLITARPTFVASFASHPVVTRLALNRLARAATQAIVLRVTRGKGLPDVLLDEIAARTDGVPLFVEEMTKAVIESGVLREGADAYQLTGPLSALAIPTTLHDSLMARLDRLQPVKEVAQTAAVIGRSFDHRTIAALAAMPESELAEAMRKLVEAELVFRRGTPPDASYLFKHALVRDAAYESMLKSRRQLLHQRLLGILEPIGTTAPEVLAQHAEAAGIIDRALDYWREAGKLALSRPAYKEAIASFEHAIRLCGVLGGADRWKRQEQDLQLQLGQALIANQGYQAPATIRAFERALALADEIGDVSLQLPAIYGLWAGQHIIASGSAELAHRFAALSNKQEETGPRVIGLRMLALERFFESAFRESLAITQSSLDGYSETRHRDLRLRYGHDPRASAANYKAWNLWHLGFPDQAAEIIAENLDWIGRLNHANTTGLTLCYGVTLVNIWLRRPEQVETAARRALQLSEEFSLALWHAWAQVHLGWALSQQSKASGIDEIERGLKEAREIGAGRLEPLHLALAAETWSRTGDHVAAVSRMDLAFTAFERGQHSYLTAEIHRMRAALLLDAGTGQRKAAEADLRRALAFAEAKESPMLQVRAARDLARLLAADGKRQQAVDLLAPIYGWFTEGFNTPDLREAGELLDELT